MPYAGKTIIPREIAKVAKQYWSNFELTKAISVALAESAGSLGAWHDNQNELKDCKVDQEVLNPELYIHMTVLNPMTGKVHLEPDGPIETHPPESSVITTRDCGLYQINIPASKVGTPYEDTLRTDSLEPEIYEPVLQANVARAKTMYSVDWMRGGSLEIRRWQPWVAYTSGWATFPEFWVWRQDADHNPVGPWVKTGRYIQRAIAAQMNYHILIVKDWTVQNALYYGKRYADHFNVKAPLKASKETPGHPSIVGFVTPEAPTEPPADGVGPRPIPNNGV
jgi:hypothetical protein